MNDFRKAEELFTRFNEEYDCYQSKKTTLTHTQQSRDTAKEEQLNAKKALILIQEVAQSTQTLLRNKVTKLVNLAIRSVFDDPPEFIMEITVKRNRTECELLFKDADAIDKPLESAGGGLLDVVSFALRVVMWTFSKTDNVLILDEPFKFVSPNLAPRVSEMVSEISTKLNLQIIMVSHAEGINDSAAVTYKIMQQDKVSTVTKL
jgi:ABC-type transporter Mla maintaining outer membrane lipid asymmetry ATPase subunit MlaF